MRPCGRQCSVVGFAALLVRWRSRGPHRSIGEDRIKGGTGLGKHSHRDMDIITLVLDGVLAHEDSNGNAATIVPVESSA